MALTVLTCPTQFLLFFDIAFKDFARKDEYMNLFGGTTMMAKLVFITLLMRIKEIMKWMGCGPGISKIAV
jgi:hypothetical protein